MVPHVDRAERVTVDELGYEDDGIVHLTFRYGFQDEHDVPGTLTRAAGESLETEVDAAGATYFLSQMTIARGDQPGMRTWRKKLFIALTRTATSPAEYFCLPVNRVVTMGLIIEL
jgi:KUP system potassium uptake protein